jgi:hypothetical protein
MPRLFIAHLLILGAAHMKLLARYYYAEYRMLREKKFRADLQPVFPFCHITAKL